MVHLTETCDPNAPRLVIHIDTTPASVHEARRTSPIHAALARKGLTPRAHLVDAAYVSARQLVEARERYGIDLAGAHAPGRELAAPAGGGPRHGSLFGRFGGP